MRIIQGPEHGQLAGGYVEGGEEVDPVDDLVTARSGEGAIIGAVGGGGCSPYRGHSWHQVGDLKTRIEHGNLGFRIRDLGQLSDQWGEGIIVCGLEIKAVSYLNSQ